MDFLRKYILQTREHLKGLTSSQRLAIGSCAALILVALLWLVQWGARPELAPLLNEPVSSADRTAMEQRLTALGVEYKVVGDYIKVPSEQRARLLAQLGETQTLPKDISITFDKLIADSTPWNSAEEQNWRRTVALGNELAKVLSKFEGVQEARVFISGNTRRSVSGPSVVPTASIFVKLAPGLTLERTRAFAMANLVCRAVPGLDITQVAVTDARTNRSLTMPSPEEAMELGGDLADRQKKEEYFANQIRGLLANIPGLLVAVHAELDGELRKETRNTWTKPLQLTDKTKTMTQQRGNPAASPGVVPNTSKSVGAGAVAEHSEETTSEGTYDTKPQSVVTIESPRNGIKSLAASVNVPRSYLAAIYKGANAGKEPSDIELKTAAQDELKKISSLVRTALAASDAVTVDWFHDDAMVQFGGSKAQASAAGGDVMSLMRTYGSKAGLVGLASLSLLMMLMMVRKVSEGPVLPGEEARKAAARAVKRQAQHGQIDPETLTVNEPPVGEAEAHENLLIGHEVDESTIRVQQVVQQVADLIKDDPKISASILESWIKAENR